MITISYWKKRAMLSNWFIIIFYCRCGDDNQKEKENASALTFSFEIPRSCDPNLNLYSLKCYRCSLFDRSSERSSIPYIALFIIHDEHTWTFSFISAFVHAGLVLVVIVGLWQSYFFLLEKNLLNYNFGTWVLSPPRFQTENNNDHNTVILM